MHRKITAIVPVLFLGTLWTSQAFAGCVAGFGCGDGGSTPEVPEIDGAGALAVVAVLVSVGAILYRKLQR